MTAVLLQTESLNKEYRTGAEVVRAVRSVNLAVDTGDFLAINGPSGSGKTTLLNLLGLIDRPTSGEVFLEGQATSRLPDRVLAGLRLRRIGMIFQTFNLISVLSAYENVEYSLLLLRMGAAERRRRVMELLDAVDLAHLAHRRPEQLSGGQRQRVGIARALAARPALVLADEPTANLDSETSQKVMQLMAELNARLGVAFVVVTHDPQVAQFARRTAYLRDGQLQDETGGMSGVQTGSARHPA
ncbi:MAG: ABC transporter ATP-binding protein [Firmicutes bacterium]|nr:ABC transporter ATP-binding protein [Bacillota bacterium]